MRRGTLAGAAAATTGGSAATATAAAATAAAAAATTTTTTTTVSGYQCQRIGHGREIRISGLAAISTRFASGLRRLGAITAGAAGSSRESITAVATR
jgi:hypothetical protein